MYSKIGILASIDFIVGTCIHTQYSDAQVLKLLGDGVIDLQSIREINVNN